MLNFPNEIHAAIYEVCQQRIQAGLEQAAMQTALLDGWIKAAIEITPEAAEALALWLKQRRYWIKCGQSRLQVGHWDLWAWMG